VDDVPETDFGVRLTRFKYGYFDQATPGNDITFWN